MYGIVGLGGLFVFDGVDGVVGGGAVAADAYDGNGDEGYCKDGEEEYPPPDADVVGEGAEVVADYEIADGDGDEGAYCQEAEDVFVEQCQRAEDGFAKYAADAYLFAAVAGVDAYESEYAEKGYDHGEESEDIDEGVGVSSTCMSV